MDREMADPLHHLGILRSYQIKSQSSLDTCGHQGNKHNTVLRETIKLKETEKSYSILSFNWKEEKLLKKKLSFLESMKKYEANARLMEQIAFYKKCFSKHQRSELAHARLLGNKELVKQLSSKNMLSNYNAPLVDDSEAAVKAIIKNSVENDSGRMYSERNLHKQRICPAVQGIQPNKVQSQTVSRVTEKADSREAGAKAFSKKLRKVKKKPALAVTLEPLESLEPTVQPESTATVSSVSSQDEDSSGVSSSVDSDPGSRPASGGKLRGKLLKFLIDHSKKKKSKPKNNPQVQQQHKRGDQAGTKAILEDRRLLRNERHSCVVDRIPLIPAPSYVQDSFPICPLETGGKGAVRIHCAGRGQK